MLTGLRFDSSGRLTLMATADGVFSVSAQPDLHVSANRTDAQHTHHNRRNDMSIDQSNIDTIIGRPVQGADGQKIGDIGQIYLDDETGKPEWATVRTGLFGTKESFVPVAEAQLTDEGLRVPYDKDAVKDAPRVDADQGHLSQQEEAELYRHYGLDVLRGPLRLRAAGRRQGQGS